MAGDTPIFPAASGGTVSYAGVSTPLLNGMTVTTTGSAYTFTGGVGDVINFNNNATIGLGGTTAGTDIGGNLQFTTFLNIFATNTAGSSISATIAETGQSSININAVVW
jgi:hypothetical protein